MYSQQATVPNYHIINEHKYEKLNFMEYNNA